MTRQSHDHLSISYLSYCYVLSFASSRRKCCGLACEYDMSKTSSPPSASSRSLFRNSSTRIPSKPVAGFSHVFRLPLDRSLVHTTYVPEETNAVSNGLVRWPRRTAHLAYLSLLCEMLSCRYAHFLPSFRLGCLIAFGSSSERSARFLLITSSSWSMTMHIIIQIQKSVWEDPFTHSNCAMAKITGWEQESGPVPSIFDAEASLI